MRAQRQGDLDGLCGVYSIVNAMEVTGIIGPRSPFHRKLFTRLLRALPEPLLRDALTIGVDPTQIVMASRSAFRWISKRYRVRLMIFPIDPGGEFDSFREFGETVSRLIADGRTAVIINVVAPGMDHWTVVKRVDDQAITVRDSGRLRTLAKSRYGLSGPFRVQADLTLVVRRVGGPKVLRAIDLGRAPER